MNRLLIDNASIIDGSGAASFDGSVLIDEDRIVAVTAGATNPAELDGTETRIDAAGAVLAPGFVDVHTHDDIALLASPDHGCKTLQGCTSVVVGNCGMSPAPAAADDDAFGGSGFETMADYLADVEAHRPAVNVAALVGHGTIRQRVMGRQNDAEPTPAQLEAMLDLLAAALDDGAIGFSSGLAYEPGRYSPEDELHEFGRVAAARGAIYTTHMRDEGDRLLESVDEAVRVAEQTEVRLQISHLKAAGQGNWGKVSTRWSASTRPAIEAST